jgi:hypothetical protein
VAAEFLEHANDEQQHADQIAARITQLGGEPDFSPEGLTTRSHAEYVEGDTLEEMIKEDLIAERIAIDSYREMIAYLAEADSTSRRMLEEILAKEGGARRRPGEPPPGLGSPPDGRRMARGLWKGAISFGLVNVPVELHSAKKKSAELDMTMLDKRDLAPVGLQARQQVDRQGSRLGRRGQGLRVQGRQVVVLSDEDFRAPIPRRRRPWTSSRSSSWPTSSRSTSTPRTT